MNKRDRRLLASNFGDPGLRRAEKTGHCGSMRLFLLTTLAMIAFAANSILNRVGVDQGGMDPVTFAAIRVLAGAVMLVILVRFRGRALVLSGRLRWIGAASLATYMLGFSLAYLTLEAGIGALILFGTVQITMFLGALRGGERPSTQRMFGALIALAGLAFLLLPGASAPPFFGSALMVAAGIGWGIYSLVGRSEPDALAGTAANFILCLGVMALAFVVLRDGSDLPPFGIAMAVLSGAVASALGYALWYGLLPVLGATRAAVSQLSVPVIAIVAGALLLNEALTGRVMLASALVLGGIALSLIPRQTQKSSV